MFSISSFIFPHFSFSAISQACFHVRRKLVSLHNHSILQSLLQVFKQLWNYSLIFNSSVIIYSLMVFASCWSMLLSPDLTVNWFLILFSSVELFLKSKTNITLIRGTEREVFLNKHAPSASLLFEAKNIPFQ